jgi:hypothetical protein
MLTTIDLDNGQEKAVLYTGNANITDYSIAGDYILVAADNNSYAIYDFAGNQLLENISDNNSDFIALTDSFALIGNRNKPTLDVLQLESNEESLFLKYDVTDKHDEARISYDENTAMLFDYTGFSIYDRSGNCVKEVKFSDSGNIYDAQFRKSKESSYLEVTWCDGNIKRYSASDGSLISEDKVSIPSEDLAESFYTDDYRIESSLHGAPAVYDIKTGKYITDLESEAYLTYVTQLDGYIITEYTNTEGDKYERYGYLLNSQLQKLAYLPNLCDITADEGLVFDDGMGNLRLSRLYSLQELVELGESYTKN